MSQSGSFEEREEVLDKKLEELYATVTRKHNRGPMLAEAQDYYAQAKRHSGEEKLYYLRLLSSMLEDF